MWPQDRLQNQLRAEYPNLGKADDILKLLHDLGDVYWHESDLRGTIVIDPSLLLEFVKEVITHNCGKDADKEIKRDLEEGRVSHKSLSEFPQWKCLDDELMYDLKCLLQQLRLAYPDKNREMQLNSDLIVPAYWKRQNRKRSKGLLRGRSVMERRGVEAIFEYWLVYKLPPELSDVIFEQFAVQNQIYVEREISLNTIEDSFKDCVVTLEHANLSTMDESKTHHQQADLNHSKTPRLNHRKEPKILDTINLQVAGSTKAKEFLLAIFDRMQEVLGDFKGIDVSCFVKDPTLDKDHKWEDLLKEMELADVRGEGLFSSKPWLPPNFKAFTFDPSKRETLIVRELYDRVHGLADKLHANSTELFTNHKELKDLMHEILTNSWKLLDSGKILGNLSRATDWHKRYPTRWKLMYDKEQRKAELHMLCDLKEKCRHDPNPIMIDAIRLPVKELQILEGLRVADNCLQEGVWTPRRTRRQAGIRLREQN